MSIFASRRMSEQARAKRRSVPIHGYVGHNGDGKSLTAIYDTLPTLDGSGTGGEPRPVLSTVRLVDYTNPRPCEGWENTVTDWFMLPNFTWRPWYEKVECQDPYHGLDSHNQAHELYIRFTKWRQLLAWRFGDVLMDEVTGVADSSDWAAVPSAIVNKFPQLRRDECALRITTLSYSNANKRIRQALLGVTKCKGSMPVSFSASGFGAGRVYRPRRLIIQSTYDAKTLPMDDPSASAWDKARKIATGRLWVPGTDARNAYDTYSPVDTIGTVSDTGRCAFCGGNRKSYECECHDYVTDRAGRSRPRAVRAAASTDGTGRHSRNADVPPDPHDSDCLAGGVRS